MVGPNKRWSYSGSLHHLPSSLSFPSAETPPPRARSSVKTLNWPLLAAVDARFCDGLAGLSSATTETYGPRHVAPAPWLSPEKLPQELRAPFPTEFQLLCNVCRDIMSHSGPRRNINFLTVSVFEALLGAWKSSTYTFKHHLRRLAGHFHRHDGMGLAPLSGPHVIFTYGHAGILQDTRVCPSPSLFLT